jgi:hypothetical protein
LVPGVATELDPSADVPGASDLLMNLATFGLFAEIDPMQVAGNMTSDNPLAGAIADTSPQPFNTSRPTHPYTQPTG